MTEPTPLAASRSEQRAGRILVGAFIGLVIATVVYFALGMPGMDHSAGTSMDGMSMSDTPGESTVLDPATLRRVDSAGFERVASSADSFVVNVHTPYDGEIDGTDLFMAFDDIDPRLLPTDRSTQLAVYCRSGDMSAIAVESLTRLGYTNIVELDGGMNAWVESGRRLDG